MTYLQTIVSDPKYLIPLLVWTLIWKGISLWKCGRNNQLRWFVALIIINTVGVLEIIYLRWFQRDCNEKKQ